MTFAKNCSRCNKRIEHPGKFQKLCYECIYTKRAEAGRKSAETVSLKILSDARILQRQAERIKLLEKKVRELETGRSFDKSLELE